MIDPKNTVLVLTKTNGSFYKGMIVFACYTLAVYGGVFLFYFFLKEKISIWAFLIFSVVFFFVFFLMNRKNLKHRIICIERQDDCYIINNEFSHKIGEPKKMVLSEFVGEIFSNSIGNVFLKIGSQEYPLYYAVTNESLVYMKSCLESFFQEELEVQIGRLY